MKTVCKTNIRKALREAIGNGDWHDVNDDWELRINSWDQVLLWNWRTDQTFHTGSVVWCCFDSKREAVEYLSDELLGMYETWMSSHPWESLHGIELAAYENAYDYFVYGESYRDWVERGHDCGVSRRRGRELWAMAFWSCADGIAPTNYLEAYENLVKEAA